VAALWGHGLSILRYPEPAGWCVVTWWSLCYYTTYMGQDNATVCGIGTCSQSTEAWQDCIAGCKCLSEMMMRFDVRKLEPIASWLRFHRRDCLVAVR
jgi:hypothetical protein